MNSERAGSAVVVDSVEYLDSGGVRGTIFWNAWLDATFMVELQPDGRLVGFSASGPGGISARRLQRVPVGAMQRAVRAAVTLAHDPEEDDDGSETIRRLALDFLDRQRPTSSGRGDAQYAAVAAMYVELLDAGDSRPVTVLADRMHFGEKTIRNYLFKARERGLLTSVGPGKAGGQLTDKAKEILDGNR